MLNIVATTGGDANKVSVSSTPKTVASIKPASGRSLNVRSVHIGGVSATSTDAPWLVEFIVATTPGTFTSVTPVNRNTEDGDTVASSAGRNASGEPGGTVVVIREERLPYPFSRTWQLDVKVKNGSEFGVRVTAPTSSNCNWTIEAVE